MDVHSRPTRKFNMSQIKAGDTKPEMIVRKFLHANGFRYRLHNKKLPGKPDITLPKYNTLIFVHGCFWHAHEGCKYFKLPKTRTDFWKDKLYKNKQRDEINIKKLESMGWYVIIVWECELKSGNKEETLENLVLKITQNL